MTRPGLTPPRAPGARAPGRAERRCRTGVARHCRAAVQPLRLAAATPGRCRAALLGVLFALVLGSAPPARAQQPQPQQRAATADTLRAGPRIALVLSGGSARGIAHTGVLLALEELGYSPEVVVGTSMGAIVGSLYAAGLTPGEIRRVTGREPWLDRFAGRPVTAGAGRVALRPLLELGVGGRSHEGLLPATGANLRLVELLFDAGARARNDFDRLPRRFRAVAADLGDGSEVVLGAGDLPRAVRASMAVPGAFAAVPWDDRVLTDGGIVNNLPVSVARRVSTLPVVAVDVLAPDPELKAGSPLNVSTRALRLLIANARPERDSPPDLLLVPELPPGDTRWPADDTRLVQAGYEAAVRSVLPAARDGDAAGSRGARPPAPPPAEVAHLEVRGGDDATRRLARRMLRPAVGGYDPAAVIAGTRALYTSDLFHAVWPRLEFPEGDDGPATLVVELTPAPRSAVAAAARWDNDVGPAAWASLRHRLSLHVPVAARAGGLADDLRRSAWLDASVFSTAWPGVMWSGGLNGGEERLRWPLPGDTVAEAVRRLGGWAGAEYHGRWFISLLARAEHVEDEAGGAAGWAVGPYLRVDPSPAEAPVAGLPALLEAEARFGERAYTRVHARAGHTLDRGAAGAVALFGDVAAASTAAPCDALPGTSRELVPWLATGSRRAPVRLVAGADIAHPVWSDGFARLRLRAAASAREAGDLLDGGPWRGGGELGIVWPTVAGIVEAGVAVGSGTRWRLNLGVGASF